MTASTEIKAITFPKSRRQEVRVALFMHPGFRFVSINVHRLEDDASKKHMGGFSLPLDKIGHFIAALETIRDADRAEGPLQP